MTRFRYPCSWNTNREDGSRPDLSTGWLREGNAPTPNSKQSHVRSYRYWTQIHWATPPWTTAAMWDEMRRIYESARGGLDEVDHVVPLKHPLVCGLNVPWNMCVLTVKENQSKSNNHWPDCPDHLCPLKNLPQDMFFDIPLWVRHPQLELML